MDKTAVVVLAEGFETIEALTPVDVLRRAGVRVVTVALGERTVVSAHGVPVVADCGLAEIGELPHALVLPGGVGGATKIAESEAVGRLAREILAQGRILAAICATPGLALSRFGVLAGRRATCYPGFEKHFPADCVFVEDRVCLDGNLLTSRGPGTALEFSYALATMLSDARTVEKLRGGMLFKS